MTRGNCGRKRLEESEKSSARPRLTLATRITLLRFLAIPAFLWAAWCYQQTAFQSGQGGEPVGWRWTMAGIFLAACITDGIDGYLARRLDQQTRLGAILDALADKALIFTALVTLSILALPVALPLWYALTVISRDLALVAGGLLLYRRQGALQVHPHWTGKLATVLNMSALGWVFFQFPATALLPLVIAAAGFTIISGLIYARAGFTQPLAPEHNHGDD